MARPRRVGELRRVGRQRRKANLGQDARRGSFSGIEVIQPPLDVTSGTPKMPRAAR